MDPGAILAAALLAATARAAGAAPAPMTPDSAALAKRCLDKDAVAVSTEEIQRALAATLEDKALHREHERDGAGILCRKDFLHLALSIAWGDCPSGCIHGETHYFSYDRRSRRIVKEGVYGEASRGIPLWGMPQAYAAESFEDFSELRVLAKDPNWGRRQYAIWFLSEMLADAGQRHRTDHFKKLRLEILGRSKESLDLVCGALDDASPDVVATARAGALKDSPGPSGSGAAKVAAKDLGASSTACRDWFKARDWRTLAHRRIPEEEDEEIADLIGTVVAGKTVGGLHHASRALEALGARAVPQLMAALAKAAGSSVVTVLCGIGPAASKAVPGLIGELAAPDPTRRTDAAKILSFIGPKAKAALPALDGLMAKDPDPEVRKMADRAVRSIRGLPPLPSPPKRVSPRRAAE